MLSFFKRVLGSHKRSHTELSSALLSVVAGRRGGRDSRRWPRSRRKGPSLDTNAHLATMRHLLAEHGPYGPGYVVRHTHLFDECIVCGGRRRVAGVHSCSRCHGSGVVVERPVLDYLRNFAPQWSWTADKWFTVVGGVHAGLRVTREPVDLSGKRPQHLKIIGEGTLLWLPGTSVARAPRTDGHGSDLPGYLALCMLSKGQLLADLEDSRDPRCRKLAAEIRTRLASNVSAG